jgi:hypothetical protein
LHIISSIEPSLPAQTNEKMSNDGKKEVQMPYVPRGSLGEKLTKYWNKLVEDDNVSTAQLSVLARTMGGNPYWVLPADAEKKRRMEFSEDSERLALIQVVRVLVLQYSI